MHLDRQYIVKQKTTYTISRKAASLLHNGTQLTYKAYSYKAAKII